MKIIHWTIVLFCNLIYSGYYYLLAGKSHLSIFRCLTAQLKPWRNSDSNLKFRLTATRRIENWDL